MFLLPVSLEVESFLLNSAEPELISTKVRNFKINSFAKEQGQAAHLLNIFTRQQFFPLGSHLKHRLKIQPSEPQKFQKTFQIFFLRYILSASTEIARSLSTLESIAHGVQDRLNRKFQVFVLLFYPQNQSFLTISVNVSKVKFKV